MGTSTRDRARNSRDDRDGRSTDLRDSPLMAHLLEALEAGTDVGHYGRLVFVMVARHFLEEEELTRLLASQPDEDESSARGLIAQVKGHGYNPPKPDKILDWQRNQDFAICPTPDDPDNCNVYEQLRFPDEIYEQIQEFWEERVEREGDADNAQQKDQPAQSRER